MTLKVAGAGKSGTAGQGPAEGVKDCVGGDIDGSTIGTVVEDDHSALDIHGAEVIEGSIVVEVGGTDVETAAGFAESAEIVEGGRAAGIATVEHVVGLSVPQTIVVDLRTTLAVQIRVAPPDRAIVGQRSAERKSVGVNKKSRAVVAVGCAQDKSTGDRIDVQGDNIITVCGNDRGIGNIRDAVGIPVGGRAPISTGGICPNDVRGADRTSGSKQHG